LIKTSKQQQKVRMDVFDEKDIRTIIKFLSVSGRTNREIHDEVAMTCGEGVVSLRTIQRWVARFKENDLSVEDRPRTGRPREEIDIGIIEDLLEDDPHISAREIARRLAIHKNRVVDILKNQLQMTKVRARWIPHKLTDSQKISRVLCAKEMLLVVSDPAQHRLVYTQDESWIHWRNPRKSMWMKSGISPPAELRRCFPSKKQMVSVMFNSEGVVSIVFLPPGESFTKRFFEDVVIENFASEVAIPKTRDKKRKIKIHCDNSRTHLIDEKLHQLNVPRLVHPSYSPDLAPCDFFLFGYVKTCLEGIVFESTEELIQTTTQLLRSIPQHMFENVYREWVSRLERCIGLNGEYVE